VLTRPASRATIAHPPSTNPTGRQGRCCGGERAAGRRGDRRGGAAGRAARTRQDAPPAMSKHKRPRRNGRPPRARPPSSTPDDFLRLPGGYMARWGRFLTLEGTLSPVEHAEMIEAFLEGASEIRSDQRGRSLERMDTEHRTSNRPCAPAGLGRGVAGRGQGSARRQRDRGGPRRAWSAVTLTGTFSDNRATGCSPSLRRASGMVTHHSSRVAASLPSGRTVRYGAAPLPRWLTA
jgi:hypothetical protein